jgi:heterodisulfide reductase subunit A-like polyferredoxin
LPPLRAKNKKGWQQCLSNVYFVAANKNAKITDLLQGEQAYFVYIKLIARGIITNELYKKTGQAFGVKLLFARP